MEERESFSIGDGDDFKYDKWSLQRSDVHIIPTRRVGLSILHAKSIGHNHTHHPRIALHPASGHLAGIATGNTGDKLDGLGFF
jgi:hypothetical protein